VVITSNEHSIVSNIKYVMPQQKLSIMFWHL